MNFISHIYEDDEEVKDIFFGPLDPDDPDDTFIIIEDYWNMAHILHKAGIFTSVSQARKNGWNSPITKGFSYLEVGKKHKRKTLFILYKKRC